MESAFYAGPSGGEQGHASSHLQHQSPIPYGSAGTQPIHPSPDHGNAHESADDKQTRLKRKRASKACDACRVRKVKCDATRNPCPQCAEHEIPCLFTVPAKKRGPPNSYVEAQKARQLLQLQQGQNEGHGSPNGPPFPYHDGPTGHGTRHYGQEQISEGTAYHAHSPNFGLPGGQRVDLGLEELATPEILNLAFDDFFALVYPICPLIVESQFRRTLSNPAMYDDDFLALCSSVLAMTVACLKSNAAKYGPLNVQDCHHFALSRLGLWYRDRMSVGIAATLECLSLSSAYSGKVPILEDLTGALYRAEFTTAVQFMIMGPFNKKSLSLLEEQMLKRMFVYTYYVQVSLALQGIRPQATTCFLSVLAQAENDDLHPIDISDLELERISQAGGDSSLAAGQFSNLLVHSAKSYVPGLTLLSGLYKTYAESFQMRTDENLAPAVRFESISSTLQKIRHYLDNVPVQLRWEENNKVHGIGFEVQKANLYVSRMHLSSVLLEQCHMLENSSPDLKGSIDLELERRHVITETLRIIKTISRRALEANGHSMVRRVRQVASTLVEIIQSQKDSDTTNARKELSEFVEILSLLDSSENRDVLGSVGGNVSSTREDGWKRFRNEQGLTTL